MLVARATTIFTIIAMALAAPQPLPWLDQFLSRFGRQRTPASSLPAVASPAAAVGPGANAGLTRANIGHDLQRLANDFDRYTSTRKGMFRVAASLGAGAGFAVGAVLATAAKAPFVAVALATIGVALGTHTILVWLEERHGFDFVGGVSFKQQQRAAVEAVRGFAAEKKLAFRLVSLAQGRQLMAMAQQHGRPLNAHLA
jgi:hypothetical protein